MEALNRNVKLTLFLIAVFLFASVMSVSGQELVRAKVGMEILKGDDVRVAKARDRIKIGNELRLLVVPEKESYIYVINSDRSNAYLLNRDQIKQKYPKGSLKVFPSEESLYKPDGKGKQESFTIVCSLTPIDEISGLFSTGTASYEKWSLLEKELIKKSKIALGERVDKPFAIAGTVRGGPKEDNLKIFSGNDLLVKRYQFQVKN